ncbi:MAG: hypothetical protein ACYSWZ_25700 [Planctomycetota bacterium]|jgi:hypothetical protein
MGLAAMIIGIVAVILGFIPVCGMIALVPAIVGLILGIIEVKKKSQAKQPKGMGMAGVVLNAVAIVFIILWTVVIAAAPEVTEPISDVNVVAPNEPSGGE